MLSGRDAAYRLRRDICVEEDVRLDVTATLPRTFDVSFHSRSGVTVATLREWAVRHAAPLAPNLAACRNRRLRGAVLAFREHGVIFADEDDPPDERGFTFTHEAGHFLRDHVYPRREAVLKLGETIRSVLDGLRPPTPDEEMTAILRRADLVVQVHLLDRTASRQPEIAKAEAEADVFACELLAPAAALARRFPRVMECAEDAGRVYAALVAGYRLPPSHARRWALDFVGRQGQGSPLGRRLGLS